jgi:hypothetical protein
MERREKIFVLIFIFMLIFFIGLSNVYASYIWSGYHYMSHDMLNKTISMQDDFQILNESLLEKDRILAIDSLIDYSDYLENEFHLELRCFIHNKEINDKLYNDFLLKAEIFNKFLKDNRTNLINNDPKAIKKLAAYSENVDRLKSNLNELSNNYPIIMPRAAFINLINPYSKTNIMVNEIVTSFD